MLLPQDEVIEIIQGSKGEFEIALVDELGRPIDTTDYDEFKVCIKQSSSVPALEVSQAANPNGSVMGKVGSPLLGVFTVLITPADTVPATLKDGERQDIDFEMAQASDATNIIGLVFKDRLSVIKTSCS